MNETNRMKDYGSENSIGLCSIDVIYSTVRHAGAVRRRGARHWPRSTSHMKLYTSKDSGSLYDIIEGLKIYSDRSLF